MIKLLRWTLDFILRNPMIFWTCVITNGIGAVYGTIGWYGPMLAQSPLWAYPFIPDCPLAAAGGSVALLGLRAGKRWPFVYALVAFACIQVRAVDAGVLELPLARFGRYSADPRHVVYIAHGAVGGRLVVRAPDRRVVA